MERSISICGRRWTMTGGNSDHYINNLADTFEPDLVAMLAVMCDHGSHALDVGANIGCTAIALSEIVGNGKVVAFEPVPGTFANLMANVDAIGNVSVHNFALGDQPAKLPMQGNSDNTSGAFISNEFEIRTDSHFEIEVPVRTLDEVFPSLSLDRVDFMKIDVEGFELNVLEGARDVLQKFKPRVVLEMNHYCLNMFRRMTIPEFRERLLSIFPHVYAIDGSEFRDFTNDHEAYAVCHPHITQFKYCNLVAGFDKTDLLTRLSALNRARRILDDAHLTLAQTEEKSRYEHERLIAATAESESLRSQLAELDSRHRFEIAANVARQSELEREKADILSSTSWRLTQPIRALKRLLK